MKSLHNRALALTAAAALTLSVSAQQPATSNQQNQGTQSMQGMQGMQGMEGMHSGQTQQGRMRGQRMNTMMQGCQKNMQTMMQSDDQAQKEIAAAKQSNDPTKMRAALDTAEKALTDRNDHMKTCMNMMNMMQNMHGKGGMMSDQQQEKKQTTPPKQ